MIYSPRYASLYQINSRVWLTELSRTLGRSAILDDVPDAELDRTAPANAPKRAIRGGSFLCNVDYCLSYRPSARRGTDPYNPMSHLGFRLVMTQQDWERSKSK